METRAPRRKPLLIKKNTKRHLMFPPKNILMIPVSFGKILCGLMRQKLDFVTSAICEKNIMATVKNGGSTALLLRECQGSCVDVEKSGAKCRTRRLAEDVDGVYCDGRMNRI